MSSTVGPAPCSGQCGERAQWRRSAMRPSALTNGARLCLGRQEVGVSRERFAGRFLGEDHTMRGLCSADAPNRLRYQGSREDHRPFQHGHDREYISSLRTDRCSRGAGPAPQPAGLERILVGYVCRRRSLRTWKTFGVSPLARSRLHSHGARNAPGSHHRGGGSEYVSGLAPSASFSNCARACFESSGLGRGGSVSWRLAINRCRVASILSRSSP